MHLVLAAAIMARQGAVTPVHPSGIVLEDTIIWLDVSGVEIDQVRLVEAGVGIMAGGAGGAILDDVLPVILPAV
jgi:hypothetical protein